MRFISIILLLIISSGLYAQNDAVIPFKPNSQKQDIISTRPAPQRLDTIKLPLTRHSHKQDSIKKPRILREWTLSPDYSEEVNKPIDTVFSLSNRFKKADSYSPVNAGLGNYGLPFYQLSFFDRVTDPDRYLYKYLYPLMHTQYNPVFMNTQTPYTELDWAFAGPTETSEQTFRVRHSQNVNRFLNFGAIYDIIFSLGQYNFQRSADKTFTFYSSYTGDKYKLYLSIGINNMHTFENGGIVNLAELADPGKNSRDVQTNLGSLEKANSFLKNRNFLLVQRYTFGGVSTAKNDSTPKEKTGFLGISGTFSHILTVEKNVRRYYDALPTSGFYNFIFVTLDLTNDSIYSRTIKNTLRFDFSTDETRKVALGGGVGIRNELSRYSYINPTPYTFKSNMPQLNENSNVLVGRIYNSIGDKFRWVATGELYLIGYRAGDFNLTGDLEKTFDLKKGRATWLITGEMNNLQPSVWYNHWGSNDFQWNNSFKKEFRVDVGTSFKYPGRNTELKFNYAIIKNYSDFDTTAFPSQFSGGLSIAAVTLKNELRIWKFHLASDVILQKSSNSEIIDLPLVTLRAAGYFEHLFRFTRTGGKLNAQLGADVTYNSLYYPYSYMPATGVFYRQALVTAGNYPYINLFLNFKVKRTRIFVMFDHFNAKLMGQSIQYNYYYVPNYPMNIRMLRYGLAWTFYD
jgi:hypothetical protein